MRALFIGIFAVLIVLLATGIFILNPDEKRVYFPDGSAVVVELAVTPEEKSGGLMFRESLDEGKGMLFVFEHEGYHAFWMKNVKFSIDILWLDENFRVTHVASSVPPCSAEPCPFYTPNAPAKYVLEVKANLSLKKGLKVGDMLRATL